MKKNVLALLLDETSLTKAVLGRAFAKTDYEVLWTENVNEALDILMRHRVDLLLLDLNRPLRTGWGVFERLIALNRGVPVLLLTDHKSAYEEAAAAQVGAVLQKPFSTTELTQAVARLLNPPSDAASAGGSEAGVAEATINAADFRARMHERYTTPLNLSSSCRHWGINE